MNLRILLSFCFALALHGLFAQGSVFGVKGGLTLGVQKINGFQQDPLFKYHGIAFVESLDEESPFAIFAQLGYHLKGSAIRPRGSWQTIVIDGITYSRPPAQQFVFRNLSLTLGGKRKHDFGERSKLYYLFGLRGDYTVSTNLEKYKPFTQSQFYAGYYPEEGFVRKFNYGMTLGGGIEFAFSELVGGLIELTINPDFSPQYKQPSFDTNRTDPYGNPITYQERITRNLTFEITTGFRFLRKVEYID